MADVTIAAGDTGATTTLTAGVVSTFTFVDNIGAATLVTDGTAVVVWTTDGSTPVLAANDASRRGFYVPALPARDTRDTVNVAGVDVVKVRSSGTPTVTVQRG